jgi:allophanate hydrolase subunit 2
MCAYLCVVGGFHVPKTLGSHSSLGPVAAGLTLTCTASRLTSRFVGTECPWPDFSSTLRCLPGLQADWFEVAAFYDHDFVVTPALNRMGVRLEGTALAVPERELVSEPVSPGAVQVTRDGQCIVLGVDGQTIGGYPKIAQVISADLDVLGQLRPGVAVRFRLVDLEEARRAYAAKRASIAEWSRRLRWSLESMPGPGGR